MNSLLQLIGLFTHLISHILLAIELRFQISNCRLQSIDLLIFQVRKLLGALLDHINSLIKLLILFHNRLLSNSHTASELLVLFNEPLDLILKIKMFSNDFFDMSQFVLIKAFVVSHLLNDFIRL